MLMVSSSVRLPLSLTQDPGSQLGWPRAALRRDVLRLRIVPVGSRTVGSRRPEPHGRCNADQSETYVKSLS